MRIVALLVLAFVIFAFLKGLFRVVSLVQKVKKGSRRENELQGGEMIEDPVCHTYIPKETARQLKAEGQIFYFCGEECAKAFVKRE